MERNEKIFRLALYGESYTDISKKYKVSGCRIGQIVKRQAYKLHKHISILDYSQKNLRSMKNRLLTILEQKK